MKEWLLKNFFKDYMVIAFRDAQRDILETMTGDLNKKANELSEKKIREMFSPVDWKKVIRIDKRTGLVYLGDEKIDDVKLSALKSEAEFFFASDLWKVICETPKELAHKAMFIEGDSIDQMKKGRSMIYTLTSQSNIIDILRRYGKK